MVSEYEVRRQGWRLKCGDTCVLRYEAGCVECILIDISVSGVLVSCEAAPAESLHPGDTCSLYLCGDPHLCPSEVTCQVTRRDDSRIGLHFLTGV